MSKLTIKIWHYTTWYTNSGKLHVPLSQNFPVHPVSHLPSHTPFTWLQVIPSLQCPTHCWLQFTPYHPPTHSVIRTNMQLFKNNASWKCLNIMKMFKQNKLNLLIIKYVILLELQSIPVHPGLHSKHAPLRMWQVISLQLVGQGVLQLLP